MARLEIELSPEEETQLTRLARHEHLPLTDWARKRLFAPQSTGTLTIGSIGPGDPLLAALDAFMEEDAQDQRETLQFLRKAVDEDRPGQRRVFGQGYNP